MDEDGDDDGTSRALPLVRCETDSRIGDDYVDYDSDYDAKAEAGRAPAVNVDPYAGMLLMNALPPRAEISQVFSFPRIDVKRSSKSRRSQRRSSSWTRTSKRNS